MARPKSITIKLTPNQRTQLRSLTGEDHKEVKFEAMKTKAGKLAPRSVGKRLAVDLQVDPSSASPGLIKHLGATKLTADI